MSKPLLELVSLVYSIGNAPTVPNMPQSRLSLWSNIAAIPSKFSSLEYSMSVEKNGLLKRPPVRVNSSVAFQVR
ncbi:hypothetical protein D3C76_1793730 [compost metagenome]